MWLYALNTDRPGNYVRKPMRECTGEEICREWLYHIGVPIDRIAQRERPHRIIPKKSAKQLPPVRKSDRRLFALTQAFAVCYIENISDFKRRDYHGQRQ